jgi:ElaB/YqjD/DUF883 family membrane-anchored ribosome-binding protein
MKDKHESGHADAHAEFETAKAAVLDAYESFLDAKKHLKKAALAAGIDFRESANEQLDEALTRARDKKDELHERTTDYVRENPLTSAGIAFLAGVVFSKLVGK